MNSFICCCRSYSLANSGRNLIHLNSTEWLLRVEETLTAWIFNGILFVVSSAGGCIAHEAWNNTENNVVQETSFASTDYFRQVWSISVHVLYPFVIKHLSNGAGDLFVTQTVHQLQQYLGYHVQDHCHHHHWPPSWYHLPTTSTSTPVASVVTSRTLCIC